MMEEYHKCNLRGLEVNGEKGFLTSFIACRDNNILVKKEKNGN